MTTTLTLRTGVCIAALCLTTSAWAQDAPPPVEMENPDFVEDVARDPAGHWTQGNLSSAEELELPEPEQSYEQLTESTESQNVETIPEVVENGRDPVGDMLEDADLGDMLFPVTDEAAAVQEFEPEATGTAGAYFSSSRLIPTSARTEYPYRTNGKIFFRKPGGGNFICSGTVIKPRLILTAGHCVHRGSGGGGGFYQNILFVPAYDGGNAPYQAWNWRWAATTGSWAGSNGNVPNRADFAIIEVEDRRFGTNTRRIGDVVGWAGFRTGALSPNHTKKIGYPGNHDSGEIMHQVDSGFHANAAQQTVLYGSDMRGGSSGGGWWENFGVRAQGQTGAMNDSPNRVVGVTSYGYTNSDPKVQGSSILNQEFLTILNMACNRRAGNC